MARRDSESESGRRKERRERKKALSTRDTWKLIFRTYWESLPYLLIMIGGLLLATWIFTEVVF